MKTTSTLVENPDGSYTYTDEEGNVTHLESSEVTTQVRNTINGHKIADYTNEDGITVDINETVTTLDEIDDGTFIYVNEEGVGVEFSTNETITTLISNGDGTYSYTSEKWYSDAN